MTSRWPQAWPHLPPRLGAFLLANVIALWVSAAALGVAALVIDSSVLRWNLLFITLAAVIVHVGAELTYAYGSEVAIYATLLATMIAVIGTTWFAPFLLPMNILVLLIPMLVSYLFLGTRLVLASGVLLVVGSGVISAIGTWRGGNAAQLPLHIEVITLLVFTPIVAAVIATALILSYFQLRDQTRALRQSRTRIAAIADATRRGLERDLHDGAQQRLVQMTVQVSSATELLRVGRTDAAESALVELGDQTMAAIQELRDLAQGIYPNLLVERGLVPALGAAARRSVVPCRLLAEKIPRLTPEVESAAYFCILEALQNASKHSGADQVEVLVGSDPALWFTVTDSGRGFDLHQTSGSGGLLGMEARISAAGGVLTIDSVPGTGTTVRGRFPVPREDRRRSGRRRRRRGSA